MIYYMQFILYIIIYTVYNLYIIHVYKKSYLSIKYIIGKSCWKSLVILFGEDKEQLRNNCQNRNLQRRVYLQWQGYGTGNHGSTMPGPVGSISEE